MKSDQHLAKARRIVAALGRLDLQADAMAIIDGTMIAGYHLANAALHAHGVTGLSTHFNTPSKFEVAPDTLPAAVKPVYDTFAKLEALRTQYVRSPQAADLRVAERAMEALRQLQTAVTGNG
jgi:hypothetical protein